MTLSLKSYASVAFLSLFVAAGPVWAQTAVQVFKTPYCGCCEEWMKHMNENGFKTSVRNLNDVSMVRKSLGIPVQISSCHTAKIGKYVIEGHVPAADIKQLLNEKTDALGLAVPGMPSGAPGMETDNPAPYDTLLVFADGSTRVFARH